MNLMNKLFILCFFLMSTISFSQVSQSIIAAKWKDGKYDWCNNKNSNNWTSKPEFVQEGQTEISFKKNEQGEVTEVTLAGKKYLPDNY